LRAAIPSGTSKPRRCCPHDISSPANTKQPNAITSMAGPNRRDATARRLAKSTSAPARPPIAKIFVRFSMTPLSPPHQRS